MYYRIRPGLDVMPFVVAVAVAGGVAAAHVIVNVLHFALQEAKRDLPRGWHLVGAMGCDFTHNFPPELQPGQIQAFLDAARGEQGVLCAKRLTHTAGRQAGSLHTPFACSCHPSIILATTVLVAVKSQHTAALWHMCVRIMYAFMLCAYIYLCHGLLCCAMCWSCSCWAVCHAGRHWHQHSAA